MALDNKVPASNSGIASFESESWGGADELLYSDTPQVVTKAMALTGPGVEQTFAKGSVISVDGSGVISLAAWVVGPPSSNAIGILLVELAYAGSEVLNAPVAKNGHYRQQALAFDASFDTDAKKQAAFAESADTNLYVSKAQFVDSVIDV